MAKSKAGQPKKFSDGKQLVELFRDFCNYVVHEREYEIIPSQTNFCEWLKDNFCNVDRKTIYNSLQKYFPDIKNEYHNILSDVVSQGAMVGKYQPSMTIFALKNWCKWTDRQELDVGNADGKAFEVNINVID